MSRILSFFYGAVSYVIFLGTFLYAVGFIGSIGVPTTLDGAATEPLGRALAINVGLLALFAVQHSVMGAQVVQGSLDADRAAADRALHLSALLDVGVRI